MVRANGFEDSLIKTIDVQLKQVFGDTATLVIYNYLLNALALKQEDIPYKLEVFTEGLDRFLSSGARVVEKIILEDLYADFGAKFQFKEGHKFKDYINDLKKTLRDHR